MTGLRFQSMPRQLPPGCSEDQDRHGNWRIYYRAKGQPKVRLRGTPWTPDFMVQYEAAKGEASPAKSKGVTPGTWRWLCTRYFAECADYLRYDDRPESGSVVADSGSDVRRTNNAGGTNGPSATCRYRGMTADAIEVLQRPETCLPRRARTIA